MFWDVGGQKLLRKIWTKYFTECDGVVFVIDGRDESRFDEARGVIDDYYSRRGLDEAGLPVVEKITKRSVKPQSGSSSDDSGALGLGGQLGGDGDLEGAAAEELSVEEILKRLPCLFLLNKNDASDFKGNDYIRQRLGLGEVNCIETVSLPVSALDLNGVGAALEWIYRAVSENATL